MTAFREITFSAFRKTVHERLLKSYETTPHAWMGTEIDVRAMKRLRDSRRNKLDGVPLRYDTFYLWAIREAFREDNRLNAIVERRDDGEICAKIFSEMNICVAMMTSRGLRTPVIAHVEAMTFLSINKAIDETIARMRRGIISSRDASIQGTFTLDNVAALGFAHGIHLTFGNSIINPPQVAILSPHAPYRDPTNPAKNLLLAPIGLAFHRGYCDADAPAAFLGRIVRLLEHIDESVFNI